MKVLLPLVIAATLGTLAAPMVHAEGTDSWVLRVGGAVVAPKDNNGTLAGARATVSSSTRPTIDLEYMFTPNWGVETFGYEVTPWESGVKSKVESNAMARCLDMVRYHGRGSSG